MKHIITITTLAYSASAFSANAVAQDSTHEACKKSVEAARAMFRSGVSDAKVPPRVAGYINGMREEDGPHKLREYDAYSPVATVWVRSTRCARASRRTASLERQRDDDRLRGKMRLQPNF